MGMSLEDERMYLEAYCTLMDLSPDQQRKASDEFSEDFKRNMREVAYRTLRRCARQIHRDLLLLQARDIDEANRRARGDDGRTVGPCVIDAWLDSLLPPGKEVPDLSEDPDEGAT